MPTASPLAPSGPTGPARSAPAAVPFGEALAFWLKLGFVSFGGPAGQIALMHEELVQRRRWISDQRFLHALNYCMVLPGPEAQQLATYIGWLMHRTWGGIAAGVLFVLPSLFVLVGLSWVYMAHGHLPLVAAVFAGIKPAVVAIVLQAAHRIGRRTLRHPALWLLAAAAFVGVAILQWPFPVIVSLAGAAGWLGGRLAPAVFRPVPAHSAPGTVHAPAVIDDDTPTPAHARFSWRRLAGVAGVGALLWSAPLGLLAAGLGWSHALTRMGWFFTKAALLTFGGAYAVLPYLYQGAVDRFGWLSATQMMDGLALGETTPGPLIMVVAFVGFVGGYGQALFGPEALALAGAAAACVATWFTFLPSFIFILAGGPLVESTHGEVSFTAPLSAISAAVVGVILNLAMFFAWHVLWPHGWQGRIDVASALIALAAALALIRFQRGVIEVIAACASVGALLGLAGLA